MVKASVIIREIQEHGLLAWALLYLQCGTNERKLETMNKPCCTHVKNQAEQPKVRVLVVNQDPVETASLCRGLFLYGYQTVSGTNPSEAEAMLRGEASTQIDLLLTDLSSHEKTGFEIVKLARAITPTLPIIVIAGLKDSEELAALRQQGIPVLTKPFDPKKLDTRIQELMRSLGS